MELEEPKGVGSVVLEMDSALGTHPGAPHSILRGFGVRAWRVGRYNLLLFISLRSV